MEKVKKDYMFKGTIKIEYKFSIEPNGGSYWDFTKESYEVIFLLGIKQDKLMEFILNKHRLSFHKEVE